MTTNQKVISWRCHQRQANPSEGWQTVDVLPCMVPGEVPGGPRLILHARALRLWVLVTRTERSLGTTALNHMLPPTHCRGQQSKQVEAVILGEAKQLLEESTGLLQVMHIISFYSNWCGDIWCCYDTSPAFESAPMSTKLYTEWMIPPKCILEFRTNTFSELSKQCSPLSRYIVYAFLHAVAWMRKWVKEIWKDQEEEEREGGSPSRKDISSVNSTATFPFRQHFSLRAEQIAKGTT